MDAIILLLAPVFQPEMCVGETGAADIHYLHDDAGIQLAKILKEASNPEKRSKYIGNFIYEDNNLLMILNSEGGRKLIPPVAGREPACRGGVINRYSHKVEAKRRSRPGGNHLGNLRMTYTSAPDPLVYKATMETENSTNEDALFSNIFRFTSTSLNKTTGGNEVLKLYNYDSANIGANMILTVMPGDTIDMDVWSTYTNSGSDGSTLGMGAMIGNVAAAFGGYSGVGGESGNIFTAINAALPIIGLGGPREPQKQPRI